MPRPAPVTNARRPSSRNDGVRGSVMPVSFAAVPALLSARQLSRLWRLLRGPSRPTDSTITAMAAAIMVNTPAVPYTDSRNVTAYPTRIELTLLQLKVKPTACARMRVGNNSAA